MLLPGVQTKGCNFASRFLAVAAKIDLKSDPKLFWKSFEEKDDSILTFTPQRAINNCTN
jgi:hypothetical protein